MHSTGGYMVYTFVTTKYVFNMAPADIYWCAAGWGGEKRTSWGGKDDRQMRGALLHHRHKHTLNTCTHTHKNTHNTHAIRCTADCGWITGHSYLTYGPLLVGASQVVFEGVPTYPAADRCWQVVDKYQVRRWHPPKPVRPTGFAASHTNSFAACTPAHTHRAFQTRTNPTGEAVLHGADRHPQPHARGRAVCQGAQAQQPQGARLRRRAHQPRGVALVRRGGVCVVFLCV